MHQNIHSNIHIITCKSCQGRERLGYLVKASFNISNVIYISPSLCSLLKSSWRPTTPWVWSPGGVCTPSWRMTVSGPWPTRSVKPCHVWTRWPCPEVTSSFPSMRTPWLISPTPTHTWLRSSVRSWVTSSSWASRCVIILLSIIVI